jgi:hypothetical protein
MNPNSIIVNKGLLLGARVWSAASDDGSRAGRSREAPQSFIWMPECCLCRAADGRLVRVRVPGGGLAAL